jgi:hypothetical protein
MAAEDTRYRSRKFLFAAFFTVVATVFTGYFSWKWEAKPSATMDVLLWFRAFAGMVLGLYGLTSITDKKLNKNEEGGG